MSNILKMKKTLTVLATVLLLLSFSSNKIKIQWNWQNKEAIIYKYSQKIISSNPFMGDKKDTTLFTGDLKIKIKGDSLADALFINMQSYSIGIDSDGTDLKKDSSSIPNSVLFQNMKLSGEIGNSTNDMLSLTLFPIPNKEIKSGETTKVPMSFPFNYFGNNLDITGFNTIQLNILSNDNLILKSDIDVSQIDLPEELETDVNLYSILKGNATHEFNSIDNIFRKGFIEMEMQFGVIELDSITKKDVKKSMISMNTKIEFELKEVIK